MFYFNRSKYDFMEIYNCIAKYYPIGMLYENNPAYNDYPGIKEMVRLLEEKIHDETNFSNGWQSVESEIQATIQNEIIGTTYGQSPCYSSYIEIEKISTGEFVRYKELYFFISLLGPFYTIVGQDRNEIRFDKNAFFNTNFLVISPENEFKELFEKLVEQIEGKFVGYRFVPYFIYSQVIDGLCNRFRRDNQSRVFEAIFNNQIDLGAPTLGSSVYKDEAWINKDYDFENEPKWVIYPPDHFEND